jgi:hypothetical protein
MKPEMKITFCKNVILLVLFTTLKNIELHIFFLEKCRTRCKLCLCLSYVIQIVTLILGQCNFVGRILQNSETMPVITFRDMCSANNFQPPGTVIYFRITNTAVFHKQLNFVAEFVKCTH